ncbi:delta endotoxin-like protein [Larkinella arboricola]|uniref:Delta endotoxin-like protein n=1 Tax=Larkinella arboricola TaxID=643671 RepID=A0A327WNB9_LARAB|nr:insecticidal delta-endotoxin Cry8Ea1 family protein [Larkinella arboricola]RAJ92994.1 delta endotoxin-like protein [Larkinella arboricola]
MLLQTGITNRRQFLERTALGAGSVLFLPELLVSCTDHRIPDPGDPPIVTPVGDYSIDWNDKSKTLIVASLKAIPEVGELLSVLFELFWPSPQEDVWAEVRDQVETLIDKKISESVYQQVKDDLQGLNNSTILYLHELKNGNVGSIQEQWIVTRNSFAQALPHFQSEGYELPLLGLFAQFANLHLALLRDGVAFGESWGRSQADQQQDLLDLQTTITNYQYYAYHWAYGEGLVDALVKGGNNGGSNACEPATTVDRYLREISLTVLDYRDMWPYYDVSLYRNGPRIPIKRAVYSGKIGYCVGYDFLAKYGYPTSPSFYPDFNLWPTQGPTQITIWGGEFIDGMQVTYPQGGGPYSNTQTPRMGLDGWTGGSTQPPRGGVFPISPANPIVEARLSFNKYPPNYDDNLGVSAIQFVYKDGATTPWTGTRGSSDIIDVKAPFGQFISSIYFTGHLVVFGFQYINFEAPITTEAIRAVYRTSPKERTENEFVQAFPSLGLTSALITDDLKMARQAYWASIKARAEALK